MSRSVSARRASRTTSKNIRQKTGLLAAAVAGVALGSALLAPARAGSFTWDVNRSSVWSDGTAWVGGTGAPTGGDTTDNLIFGGSEGAPYTSTVDSPDFFIINGLTLNSSASTTIELINNSNISGISFGGTNPFITQNGTGPFQIDAPIVFGATTTFAGNGSALTTLNGAISGGGGLSVTNGTWRITNANNSWAGGTTITGGRVELFSNGGDIGLLATGPTRLGTGGALTLNASTPGGQAELKFISGLGKTLAGGASKAITVGANGGQITVDGSIADNSNFALTLTNGAIAPIVLRFNGGPNHLSANANNNGNWSQANNALRLNLTSAGPTAPIRIELDQGAMFVMPGVATNNSPLTVRGVPGGDPTSGPNGTVHTGISLTTGRLDLPGGTNGTYILPNGLFLEGAIQTALEGASRAIDGNITVRGTASGNPGIVSFHGRGTGTGFGTGTLNTPNGAGAGHNVLYLGVGGNDLFTIQDGGTAILDLRIRTEVAFAHGVLVNSRTVLNEGGTLKVLQSLSNFSPVTPAPLTTGGVGNEIFQGNIEAQGSTAKESVIDLYVPFKNTLIDNSPFGGVEFQSTSNLIVNGTGTGGLMVKGTARPNALFSGATPDPVSNADKVANLLSVARLQALTGTGGYLTPAPTGVTFTMPAGGEWANSVTVGLKAVDSNSTGDDVALGGAWNHNVFIAAGATLNGSGNTIGPAAVTANLGVVKGTGTLSNAIINTGGRLAPGNSIGTMLGSGGITINGTYEAEVTTVAQDLFAVTGNLNLGTNSILDLPLSNTYDGSSPYTIATYTGNLLGAFDTVNNLPSGYIVDYGTGSNSIIRLFVPPPGARVWTGAVNNNWDTTTGNWAPSNYSNGTDALFDDSATGPTNINIVSAITPSSVTVNNTNLAYSFNGAAITGATGLVKGFGGVLTINNSNSFTGPVTIRNGVISVATISASGVSGTLGSGTTINMGDVSSAGTLRFTGVSGSTNRTINLTGGGGIFDTPAGSSLTLSGVISGSGTLTKINAGNLTISGNNTASFSGPVTLLGTGTTTASNLGALGTGGVTVGDGTSANANVLNYNVAGAAAASSVVTATPLSTVNLGASLGAGDRISINADAVLTVNGFASSVNRGGNLTAADGAIIAEFVGSQNNSVLNKGTAADLYFGLANNITDTISVGSGNPWKGVSSDALADRTLNNGSTINAASDFTLHSINGRKLILGSSGGGVTINGGPVNANIASYVVLAGTAASYNGVNFDVHGGSTLELLNTTVLGSGANKGHVTVESGGLLKVTNATAANGNVDVLDGGVMDLSLPGYSGTGVITEQPGGILQVSNAGALTGPQITPAGVGSGAVVRMGVDNITNINTVNGAAVFEIYNAGGSRTQDAGINLNGGVLTQDNADATLNSAAGVGVGAAGGTIASTTGKTFTYTGAITTTNTLTAGTTATIDGNAKLGTVSLTGALSAPITVAGGTLRVSGSQAAAGSFNMVNGTLSMQDGFVLNGQVNTNNSAGTASVQIHAGHNGVSGNLSGTGAINLTNGEDAVGYVEEVITGNPALINIVPTTVNVLTTGTLASDREGAALGNTGLVRFTDVRLHPNSTLTFQRITENIGAELTLLGSATIQGQTTGNTLRVGNINDNSAGHTLNITGNQDMRLVGALQGTTRVRNFNSGTVQLNTTNFNPSYTSSFSLGGNTYEQAGAYNANVSGAPNPGFTGGGNTNLQVDPGVGTFKVTGGNLNLQASAPQATVIANGGRITFGTNVTIDNLNLVAAPEVVPTGLFTLTVNNLNVSPHGGMVLEPNGNLGVAGGSFVKVVNNPPTVTNGIVSPNIVRKTAGGNDPFFLTYDATNGFTTAAFTVTVNNTAPADPSNINTVGPNDVVLVDGPDTSVGNNVNVTLANDITVWAMKTDQGIDGVGKTITIRSGGLIDGHGSSQERVISANLAFGDVEAFISGRDGGDDTTNNLGTRNRLTVSGIISGTAGLTKLSGGDLRLSGLNTFTGPVTIQRGRLVIGGGTGIGQGPTELGGDGRNLPLTINGNASTFNATSGTPVNHHPSVFELNGNGGQSADGVYGNGAISNAGPSAGFTINKSAGSAEFSGAIVGNIFLTKLGPGTQIFSPGTYGTSTYSGGTSVNEGTLLVNNTAGSGTGPGRVDVLSGATLGGSGSATPTGSIVFAQTGAHIAPGAAAASVGTLTLDSFIAQDTNFDYEGAGATMDRLNVLAGGFTPLGTNIINVSNLGGLASGDYIIIDYNNGGTPLGDLSNFTLGTTPVGYNLTLNHDTANQDIILHVVSSGPPQWINTGGGSWNTAGNWTGGVPNASNAIANFLSKITAPSTVTLDGSKQVQEIHFDNANKYTVAPGSGGTLTVGNGTVGTIEVVQGTHEISAALSLSGSVSKTGVGTLIISGAQSNAAGSSLTVAGGTLNLNSNPGGGTAATSPLTLHITGSKVALGADADLKELDLPIANAGNQTLDLASPVGSTVHSLRIYAADLAGAKSGLWLAIRNANVAGSPTPLDGIMDSGLHTASGIGMAVAGDHVTIRSTRIGDLNLDGTTTIADFIALASHFNQPGTWQEGDVNYDGNVTIADFISLASNFNQSYSGASNPINPTDMQLLANFASSNGVDPAIIGSGAVPEPGTLSLLAIGALSLTPRRRRNVMKITK